MFGRFRSSGKLFGINNFLKYAVVGGLSCYTAYLLIKIDKNCQCLMSVIYPKSVLYIPNLSNEAISLAISKDPEVFFQIPQSEETCKIFVSYWPTRFDEIPDHFKTNIKVCASRWISLIHAYPNVYDLPENSLTSKILSEILYHSEDKQCSDEFYNIIGIGRLIADQQSNLKHLQSDDDILNYLQNNDIFKDMTLWCYGSCLVIKYPEIFNGLSLTGAQFNNHYEYIDFKYEHYLSSNIGLVLIGTKEKSGILCAESDGYIITNKSIIIPDNALVKINKSKIEIDKIILGPIQSSRCIDHDLYE